MKSKAYVLLCRILIAAMMVMSFQSANAGMIGTEQAIASASSQADRNAVLGALSRAEVSQQLLSLGIDPQRAKERVAAMTDEEVRTLAGKLDSLPAGASSDWGWWLLAVLLIGGAIWYFYAYK